MTVQDGDVIRATVIHDNATSGEQVNVYQYQLSTGSPVDNSIVLDDILDILEGVYNIVSNMINIANILREVNVFNLTQRIILGSGSLGTYSGGTGAGDQVPQGVAALAHFKTTVPRVVLSKYLPSMSIGTLGTDGTLTGSALTTLTAYASAMLSPDVFNGRTYEYGYLSPLPLVGWIEPVSAVARDIVAYQRRRKPGRGS